MGFFLHYIEGLLNLKNNTMRLKNIKKLLGDEVYPLWLENFIEHSQANERSWQGWVKGMRRNDFLDGAFTWDETLQGDEYWYGVYNQVQNNTLIRPWWLNQRPNEELPRTD